MLVIASSKPFSAHHFVGANKMMKRCRLPRAIAMTASSSASSTIPTPASGGLEPRLRFPEFRARFGYSNLANLGSFIGGGTPSTQIAEYWSGTIPWISSSDVSIDDIFGLNISRKITESAIRSSATKIVPKGSVLIVSRVGVGKVAIASTSLCTSQDFINFVPAAINNRFIAYFLLSQRSKLISMGQGTSISGFSKSDLELIRIPTPTLPEQQKIADCLSSLDDLIGAESEKLEALKMYKKGLMQELFPREGETVPRIRFPEFEGSGEWEVKRLDVVAPLQRGFDLRATQIVPGHIPVVYSNGIQKYHNQGMAKGPGLVTGRSGTIGKIHFIEADEYWPHNTALWVTNFHQNDPKFVYYLYKSIDVQRFSSGSGVPTLNRNDLHRFEVRIPCIKEQQKIAAALSCIDARISAQDERIEVLKEHKKGLMQQLFPVMEG